MTVTCIRCYEDFTVEDSITGFCSDMCYQHWTDSLCFTANCNTKFYSKKRRQKIMSGDKINRIVLSEEFGWVCQLCFSDIHPNSRFPDVMSSTVDHIVPLAVGGTHTFENVQPAHLKCNLKKGDKWLAVPSV